MVHRAGGEFPASDLINHLYHTCLFAIKTHTSPLPKCKNPESRIATYKLLVRIAQRSPENMTQIVKLLARNHTGIYQQVRAQNNSKKYIQWLTKRCCYCYYCCCYCCCYYYCCCSSSSSLFFFLFFSWALGSTLLARRTEHLLVMLD